MIRNEPWEQPTTLHDMQQQIKTLHDENKQQWYGRPQQAPGVPPLWLGFYDPEAPAEECDSMCTGPCLDLQIPHVTFDDVVIEADAVRVDVTSICNGLDSQVAYVDLPNNPGKGIQVLGGLNCCFWTATVYDSALGAGYGPLITFRPSTGAAPCAGTWHWSYSNGTEYPVIVGDFTATEVDCEDPPPTPSGTGSGSGGGGGGEECDPGEPRLWYWDSIIEEWVTSTDGNCGEGCVQVPPSVPGTYYGELRAGTCAPA